MSNTINKTLLQSRLPVSPHRTGSYASGNYQGHRPREPDPWWFHTIIFYQMDKQNYVGITCLSQSFIQKE